MTGAEDAGQFFEMSLGRLTPRARVVRSVLGVALSPCQEKAVCDSCAPPHHQHHHHPRGR